jgi:DNA-binding response OmpR family regulator
MKQPRIAGEPVLVIAPLGPRVYDWCANLRRHRFIVDFVDTPDDGLAFALESGSALILIATAEMGLGIIRALRDEGSPAGILAVTSANDTRATVDAIESGADLCVGNTCSGAEVVARLNALVRRRHTQPARQRTLWTLGDLVIDPLNQMVTRGDALIPVSPRAFAVLLALLRRRGRVVSHQELLRDVWREPPRPKMQIIAALILQLRIKLEPDRRAPRYILTVRSTGYLIP